MFVKFTDPNNCDVWIVPRWVTRVRAPIGGRHADGTRALVVMGNFEQAVTQTVDEVLRLLEDTPSDDDAAVRRA
jgi:hypothetical protein